MNQLTSEQQQSRVRRIIFFMGLFTVGIVVVCGFTVFLIRESLGDRREPETVLDGATVHTLVELPGDDAHPLRIVVGPDDNLYVSSFCTGTIWQITPEGERSTWYDGDDVGAAGGLAFDNDGNLYVVDRGDCDPREGTSRLKRISADGAAVDTISGIGEDDIPNDIVVDPTTNILYFTDTQHSNVRYIDEEGSIQEWWELPEVDNKTPRPTGLEYDPINDALIIADTASGTIYRVPFAAEREPLEPHQVIYQDSERELDGLTITEDGEIIFTMFNVNKVARLMDQSGFVIAEEFREPSDVAYLNDHIYVTNFDGVGLAPIIGFFVSPSLPFTVDVITMPEETPIPLD
ncbi:MAG: SMP-30/gluconolactonase/LRE family protein [Chloroflexi bacterium]|nr:SMP-30/gluconolactonase/LRE family protein [Chloroflexota bacterium]